MNGSIPLAFPSEGEGQGRGRAFLALVVKFHFYETERKNDEM